MAVTIDWSARRDAVWTAIEDVILGGQDVTYEGRRVTLADLDALKKLHAECEQRLASTLDPHAGRNRISYITPQS
jgi:hypothetical protein